MKSFFATIVVLMLFFVHTAIATTYYTLENGAGDLSGSSWENASAENSITNLLLSLKAGDTLNVGSGNYSSSFSIKNGGDETGYVTIKGVDTGAGLPKFTGKWDSSNPSKSNNSWAGVQILGDVHYIEVTGFEFEKYMHMVTIDKGKNHNIKLSFLSGKNLREGIKADSLNNSEISNCSFTQYKKRGIRFETKCENISVKYCIADATQKDPLWSCEAYPFGFSLEGDSTHAIVFENCISQNNHHERTATDYWNGDGFVLENMIFDISFINCEAYSSTDGGWDDKGANTSYENCISIDNKRNYRIWYGVAKFNNCIAAYSNKRGGTGGSCGIWANGAVEVQNMTFHNNTTAVEFDNTGYLVANNSIFSVDVDLVNANFTPNHTGSGNIFYGPDSTLHNPQYSSESSLWRNDPVTGFNSIYAQSKGYFYGTTDVINETVYQANNYIEIYPQPIKEWFVISMKEELSIDGILSIYSENGVLISSIQLTKENGIYSSKITLESDQLSLIKNRVYFVSVDNGKKRLFKRLYVVR